MRTLQNKLTERRKFYKNNEIILIPLANDYIDVKLAVLEFEKEIKKQIEHCKKYKDVEGEEDFKYLLVKYEKLFGDFEK
jgi:hypothetical protein